MSPMVKTREYTPTLTSIIPKARKQQASGQRVANVGPCGDLFSPPALQAHLASSGSRSSMGLQGILDSLPAWNTHRPHLTGYDIIEVSRNKIPVSTVMMMMMMMEECIREECESAFDDLTGSLHAKQCKGQHALCLYAYLGQGS